MEIHGKKMYITPEEVEAGRLVSPRGTLPWQKACKFENMAHMPPRHEAKDEAEAASEPGADLEGELCFVVSAARHALEFRASMKQVVSLPEVPGDDSRSRGIEAAWDVMKCYKSWLEALEEAKAWNGGYGRAAQQQSEAASDYQHPQYTAGGLGLEATD